MSHVNKVDGVTAPIWVYGVWPGLIEDMGEESMSIQGAGDQSPAYVPRKGKILTLEALERPWWVYFSPTVLWRGAGGWSS